MTLSVNYQCPVCGYAEMIHPASDHYICPCCGTEFDNDNYDKTFAEIRLKWVSGGMKWFSRSTPQPENWSPKEQLLVAGLSEELVSGPRTRQEQQSFAIDYSLLINERKNRHAHQLFRFQQTLGNRQSAV